MTDKEKINAVLASSTPWEDYKDLELTGKYLKAAVKATKGTDGYRSFWMGYIISSIDEYDDPEDACYQAESQMEEARLETWRSLFLSHLHRR